ncbi:SWIM zinc finger family protein [Streptomyces sp. NPDC046759]|uniref:SWIM zinc finger family protein n=1 Tax=Streptomyces sp. NPDC046759 TaxID=3155019 RepID=UPI0033ECA60F
MVDGPWGALWIAALENPGSRDSGHEARLNRARTYARRGAVSDIIVRKGEVTARVTGSGHRPYKVTLRIPELPEAEGDRLLEAWTDDLEAVAELSLGRLGEATARLAVAEDVALVPKPGLTHYECTCPDWGFPCKHAAAVSYQFARAIDARPDALLLLRGQHLNEVCDQAAVRRADREVAAAEQAAEEAELARAAAGRGVPAGEAFIRIRKEGGLPPLPPLPSPIATPARTGPFPETGHEDSLAAPGRLRMLADDAAHRAAEAYAHAVDAGRGAGERLWLDADPWLDTVRRAAQADDDPSLHGRLLNSSDQARAQLARTSVAWKHGGEPALAVLDGGQAPPRATEVAARERLLALRLPGRTGPPTLRRTGGRLQLVGEEIELRYGRDGHWYPFRKESGVWWPAGPPSADAAEALQGILKAT